MLKSISQYACFSSDFHCVLFLLYKCQSYVIRYNVHEYQALLVGWMFYQHEIHLPVSYNVFALIPFLFDINIAILVYVSISLVYL